MSGVACACGTAAEAKSTRNRLFRIFGAILSLFGWHCQGKNEKKLTRLSGWRRDRGSQVQLLRFAMPTIHQRRSRRENQNQRQKHEGADSAHQSQGRNGVVDANEPGDGCREPQEIEYTKQQAEKPLESGPVGWGITLPGRQANQSISEQDKLARHEIQQIFGAAVREAIRVEADFQQVDSEPGDARDDVAENRQVHDTALAHQAAPASV